MVSTRFFLTILPFGHALAQDWNGWEGPDEYVTTTITNTKTVCPCDSTSWGEWATASSSMKPYESWASASPSTKPYESWASVSTMSMATGTAWENVPQVSSTTATPAADWYNWQGTYTTSMMSSSSTSTTSSSSFDPNASTTSSMTSTSSTSSTSSMSTTSSSSSSSSSTTTTTSTSTTSSSTTSTTTAAATPFVNLFLVQAFNNPAVPGGNLGSLVLAGNVDEQYLTFATGAVPSILAIDSQGYLRDPATQQFANIAPGVSDQVFFDRLETVQLYNYTPLVCQIINSQLFCSSGSQNTFNLDANGNLYLSAPGALPAGNAIVTLTVTQ